MTHDRYLPLFRTQCNADDGDYDTAYMLHLLEAAFDEAFSMTRRTEQELIEDYGDGELPRKVVQAAMMIGAHWYNQREAASQGDMRPVPFAVSQLLAPYRRLVKDDSGNAQA